MTFDLVIPGIFVWALIGIVTVWLLIDSELRLCDMVIAAVIGPIGAMLAVLDSLEVRGLTLNFRVRKARKPKEQER